MRLVMKRRAFLLRLLNVKKRMISLVMMMVLWTVASTWWMIILTFFNLGDIDSMEADGGALRSLSTHKKKTFSREQCATKGNCLWSEKRKC